MDKLLSTFLLLIIFNFSYSQDINSNYLENAKIELKSAVEKEDYKKAAELKDEIEIRQKIKEALDKGDYKKASELKSKLETKDVTEPSKIESKQDSSTLNSSEKTSLGYKPPEEGKALIEFVRVTGYGWNAGIKFFIGEEYYTTSYGVSRIRVEIDPGEHLFWIQWDISTDFLKAKVEANQTYVVYIDISARISNKLDLNPVKSDDLEKIERALKVINKHPPKLMSISKFEGIKNKLEKENFISKKMKLYEKKYMNTKKTAILTSEFAIPKELLK